MDPREILVELGRKGSRPPVEALRAAAEQFSSVCKPLMMVLEVAAEDPWILSEEEVWQLNYSFSIFAAKRHRPALEPLLGYLSWADEDAHDITGDFATEDAARVIAAVACGDGAVVADATRRKSLRWYATDAMDSALGIMALEEEWPRSGYLSHMAGIVEGRLLDHSADPVAAWSAFADLASSTHLHELRAGLRGLYQAGLVDPGFLPEAEMEAGFANPEAPAEFLARHPVITDPAVPVARWPTCWEETSGGGAVRKILRVGRNNPCPCGSGLKHKRCCGKGAEVDG